MTGASRPCLSCAGNKWCGAFDMLFIVAALIAWISSASGSAAMTAGEWYDACVRTLVMTKQDRAALTVDQRLALRQCKLIAAQVWCNGGYVGAPIEGPTEEVTRIDTLLKGHCPNWMELPFGGIHFVAVKYWEERGGITWIRRWFSAESVVEEAFQARWPSCPAIRRMHNLTLGTVENLQRCVHGMMQQTEE